MRVQKYIFRRLFLFVPQALGVVTLVFVATRLLPGNPAFLRAGSRASQAQIDALAQQMGLDRPIYEQYLRYLAELAQGNMGHSWMTGRPVADDLLQRVPATLELITAALLLALAVALPLGLAAGMKPGGAADRVGKGYGLLAGALPDFWWGLALAFVFFGLLGIAPAPIGRLGLDVVEPPQVTGFYTIDSLLAGDLEAFASAVSHLALPTITLAFVYAGAILRITRASVAQVLNSRYIAYARSLGLPQRVLVRYVLRNASLPIITIVGLVFGYLLGGAVLVERVFAWGGVGQYAVQAVATSDYDALTGTVLAATLFSLVVYLVVDLLYLAVDPRVEY